MSNLTIIPTEVESENIKFQSYQRNGLNITPNSLEEWIILRTGAINKNKTKTFELSNLATIIRPVSIWVDSQDTNRDAIKFFVFENQNQIFRFDLNNNQIPFNFPTFVLAPTQTIKVQPLYNIDNCIIYCCQVVIIAQLQAI